MIKFNDEIRNKLKNAGIQLEDTLDGARGKIT